MTTHDDMAEGVQQVADRCRTLGNEAHASIGHGKYMRTLWEAERFLLAQSAELTRLRAKVEAAEAMAAALVPISKEAKWWLSRNYHDREQLVEGFPDYGGELTCGDLFRATEALAAFREVE